MSHIIRDAIHTWRACRDEFELHRLTEYELAERATNGYMLNARGRAAGIDPLSLFMGNEARAAAYASEELLAHWETRPRPTFAKFERQWLEVQSFDVYDRAAS